MTGTHIPSRSWSARLGRRAGMVALLIVLVLLGSVAGAAWAYWLAGTTAGSNGASAATTVNGGATPTVVAAGSSVTVSWVASTLATGVAVDGYTVNRYDSATLVSQTVLTGCNGAVTATTCTESGVPDGLWIYKITPTKGTQWTGPQSPASAAMRVDTTAPTNSLALSNVSLSGVYPTASKTGNTVYYRGTVVGSFTLTNAVADAGSGPASSATSALGGTSTGWTHTPSTVSTPSGGPYQSNSFSWTAGTLSSPTEAVSGGDIAGNGATTNLSFLTDSSGPTGGSMSYSGGYATSSVTLTFAMGTDARSGTNGTFSRIKRSVAPLVGGVCGTYVTNNNYVDAPTSPYVDTNFQTGNCYTYQYAASDNLGNFTFYTSPNVVLVDTTPPTNSISLSSATGAAMNGSTIYYRGTAAGSFSLTNAVADAASGAASSATAALTGTSTGWTHTPSTVSAPSGGPYVSNTFTWSAGTATSPSEGVTGNDAAGNSATTSLTLVNDSTAPTTGTVSYVDGSTGGTTVSVSFTTGTDAGSGVGTRLLQRASAAFTGITCGAYGAFATVSGGTNPTSPLVDTVTTGNCYKYQYVVADNVGNTQTATSPSVAHTPFGAYWAFDAGSGTLAVDSSGNGNTATLQGVAGWTTGKVGASALNLNGTATSYVTAANPVIDSSQSYTVSAWVKLNNLIGVQTFASIDGATISPFYLQMSGGKFDFAQRSSDSTVASLAQVNALAAPTVGTWYHVAGVYNKATGNIELFVNGASQGTATAVTTWKATGLTTIGRAKWAGLPVDFANGAIDEVHFYDRALTAVEVAQSVGYSNAITGTSGLVNYWRLGESSSASAMADIQSANNGSYFNSPTMGVAGGIATDSNTAVQFDGVSAYATAARQVSGDLSIEFLFKSTQNFSNDFAQPHCTFWWQGAGLVDADTSGAANDFGISLCSGKIIAGVGNPDTNIVTASTYNDGGWHHVVFTRTQSTGAMQLYVDGAPAGSATGNVNALTATTTLNFGRSTAGVNYFAGTLDEVAIYNTVLSAATVTAHRNAAQ